MSKYAWSLIHTSLFIICLGCGLLFISARATTAQQTCKSVLSNTDIFVWLVVQEKIGAIPFTFSSVQYIEAIFPEFHSDKKAMSMENIPHDSKFILVEIDSMDGNFVYQGTKFSEKSSESKVFFDEDGWKLTVSQLPDQKIDALFFSNNFDAVPADLRNLIVQNIVEAADHGPCEGSNK